MIKFCIFDHIFWDINDRNIVTLFIIVDISLHFKKVNDTFEFIFLTDWELNADSILT